MISNENVINHITELWIKKLILVFFFLFFGRGDILMIGTLRSIQIQPIYLVCDGSITFL